MISADDFLTKAKTAHFDFYTGVPCSFLTPLINRVISDSETAYVGAASEGEAVGIAAGAWLAGRETVVMIQNSGLGNTVNPLTSLNYPFRIPTLLITTWRGGPGVQDEPQHELMGEVTPDVLDAIRIPHQLFPTRPEDIDAVLDNATQTMKKSGLPAALIMEKGAVQDEKLEARSPVKPAQGRRYDYTSDQPPPMRFNTLERLLEILPEEAAVIATTGKCGRELFTLADRPQHLYQVGSMGCAAGMGLGVALNVQRPVVVLDGDGAALMKMGTMATVGAYAPARLTHIILDNGVHDSTGGQPTVSTCTDFAAVALACGYQQVFVCDDLAGFEKALQAGLTEAGPTCIHLRIAPGSIKNLGRPTISPHDVARRFKKFLAG